MYDRSVSNEIGYDLVVEQICKRYGKLPNEVLKEDKEWLEFIQLVISAESKRDKLEEKRAKQKSKVR